MREATKTHMTTLKEDNLIHSAKELWLGQRYIFQKDNDLVEWPRQSPDLNPKENFGWTWKGLFSWLKGWILMQSLTSLLGPEHWPVWGPIKSCKDASSFFSPTLITVLKAWTYPKTHQTRNMSHLAKNAILQCHWVWVWPGDSIAPPTVTCRLLHAHSWKKFGMHMYHD